MQKLVRKADKGGSLADTALYLLLVQTHVARAVGNVPGAGLLKELVFGVLHDKTDKEAEAAQVGALLPQVAAVHQHAAGGRAVQAVEVADQGRFAAARGADNAHEVALLHGERNIVQRFGLVRHTLIVNVAQIFYTNDLGHSGSFPAGYSPGMVPFRHMWDVFERKASPVGRSCPRSGLMRGDLAVTTHCRVTAVYAPLIRPCGATFPHRGKAGDYFSSLNSSSAHASGVITFSGMGMPSLTSSSRSSAACGTSRW